MIFQGRNLTQGLTGADVGALQDSLAQLGYTITPAELQAKQFGASTLAAVQQAQAQAGVAATGSVDATSANALDLLVGASTFVVSGRVTCAVSAAVSGLTVRLVDKNVGGDVSITSTSTDASGRYNISTVLGPRLLWTRSKKAPDFQTQVIRAQANGAIQIVAVSPVAIGAPSPLTLDIVLPDDTTDLPSEYETLTASLTTLYTGRLKDL